MEREVGEIILIVGGVTVLGFYGWKAHYERRRVARHPPRGSPEWKEQVRRAFEAEFGESCESDSIMDSLGVVVCSACGEKFIAGTPFCESCGKPTTDEEDLPVQRVVSMKNRRGAPLVCVFSTSDMVEAEVVRSLLESHEVRTFSSGQLTPSVYPFSGIGVAEVRLMALESEAVLARQIIQSAR